MSRFNIILSLYLSAVSSIVVGCSSSSEKKDQTAGKVIVSEVIQSESAEVDTISLQPSQFTSNIVSNGRIKAREAADIYFRSSEVIREVLVKNGQRVRKGQPLARLDTFKLQNDKVKNEAALEQARIELQDVLISQGYDPVKTASIPADVMRLARIKSGLDQAEATCKATRKDIELSTLTAPFDGIVANVKASPHSVSNTSEPFCRIINDRLMDVEFPVLESEAAMIAIDETVDVTPFSTNETSSGRIIEINPLVDENGQVSVKASVSDSRGLVDGMNVRIKINHNLGTKLSVPKSAVVLRSGKQVVFTWSDGKAMWNYVTTGLENFDSYEIVEGLEPGMTVIFKGNENLAHETPVTVSKK